MKALDDCPSGSGFSVPQLLTELPEHSPWPRIGADVVLSGIRANSPFSSVPAEKLHREARNTLDGDISESR